MTLWDITTDTVKNGDLKRNVSPITSKTFTDENGFKHYTFSKTMFDNPIYRIPKDEFNLFKKFIYGGARFYPSDGALPCDIVTREARLILDDIVRISQDKNGNYFDEDWEILKDGRKLDLVRGTIKLYLRKYTARDWRRKRFTDDIDFWIYKISLFEHVLQKNGWTKNRKTKEWKKKISWINLQTNENRQETLIAANDLDQLLDFGAGAYLEGSNLKEIFRKKIKRGHDVDISDIINVAMVNDGISGKDKGDWLKALEAFEEAANTRNTKTTSNFISICRYSYALADHHDRIGKAIEKYHNMILNKDIFDDIKIKKISKLSKHWIDFLNNYGTDLTRSLFHDYYIEQAAERKTYGKNLRNFANQVLDVLNSRYAHHKVIFDIEK